MSSSSRVFAFIAYLIPLIGPLFVFAFRRNDEFAIYHARQSLRLFVVAVVAVLIWAGISYGLLFIPYLGSVVAAALSAVLLVILIAFLWAWIAGMLNALRAHEKPLPFVGSA